MEKKYRALVIAPYEGFTGIVQNVVGDHRQFSVFDLDIEMLTLNRIESFLRHTPLASYDVVISRGQSAAVAEAFRYGKMVAMSSTYDGGLFPPMDQFMAHLRDKTYRSRRVALIENGSWAPSAAKHMRAFLEGMKDITICETVHTIQGAVKESDIAAMKEIAGELLG